jgi:uncharacterized protein DUF6941
VAKLFLATLCDDVREEKTGKFSLVGLFDRFIVADFRAPLPTFFLFAQIGCDSEGDHELAVEFKQVDGTSVLRADLKHSVVGRSSVTGLCHANINLRLEQVMVPGIDNYEFALRSDGQEIGSLPIEVIAAAPRVATESAGWLFSKSSTAFFT